MAFNLSNFTQDLGGILGGISGGFATPEKSTTNSTTNSNQSSSSTPTLQSGGQNFLDLLTQLYTNYVNQSPDLRGYQAQQGNIINSNSELAAQNANENLASRGLATSPVAASTLNNINLNRVNQQNTLAQQIPLLQRQLQQQALQTGGSFAASLPRGVSSTSSGTQSQNSTTTKQSGGGLGSLLGGLGSAAASFLPFFSDERMKDDMKPLKGSLKLLSKLEPIKFKWKENGEDGHGFSAQQVKKVLPKSVVRDDEGFHRLDMASMIPHLVNAVNELAKKKAA